MQVRLPLSRLKSAWKLKRKEIRRRLADFKRISRSSDDEIFLELVFCILTPQSRARAAEGAVFELKKKGFPEKNLRISEIRACLKGVRFPNNKSMYVALARESFLESKRGRVSILPSLPLDNPLLSRNILVKKVKGLGMKEASHFLRNIGYGESLAILDIHVLRRLVSLGILREIPKGISPKAYLEIEGKMGEFCKREKIPLGELDLLLWSDATGEIFK